MRRKKRLLVIGTEGYFGREVLRGIDAYCGQAGNWEFHMEGGVSADTGTRVRHAIRGWRAEGVIARIMSASVEHMVRRSGLPAVNFSGVFELDMPTVRTDDAAVGLLAARHFLDNGLKNFGFYARTGESYATRRCGGFIRELAKAESDCDVFIDRFDGATESNWVQNRQRMERWLLSLPKPVGVMCIHDFHGLDVIRACGQLGLRVPDDVAVVGVDNEELICRMCNPPLSSVQVDQQRVGFEAARLIDRLIQGRQPPRMPILVAPRHVVMRQSSNIVAVDDPQIAAAIRFIRDHASEPITIKHILREVPISRRAMEIRFVKLLGRTPREEMTRVRIARAKSLLAETQMSIPAVARAAGFTSRVSFFHFFRRIVGVTPRQYRQGK